jgi:amidohydrolase
MTTVGLADLHAAWAAALEDELPAAIQLRHGVHAAPELSGFEAATAQKVTSAIGVGAGTETAGTGRVLRVGPPGPAVAVRAELDGLPVVEATGAEYASTNGAMHACGHDVHLAALTALTRAALALQQQGVTLPAGLVAVLQPREEVGPTGATDIVAEGTLAQEDVRAIVGAHLQPQVSADHVACDAGPVNAAVDEVEIVVVGSGGHGAYPHLSNDPVPPLCQIVLSMQEALRSAVDPLQPAVVSITQLSGADAPNVIAHDARAAGTIRTMRPTDAIALHERVRRLVESVAAGHGCTGRYIVRRGEPALDNDARMAEAALPWLAASGLTLAHFVSCGSDDFATYGEVMPILMLFVGTGPGAAALPAAPMLHDAGFLPPDSTVRHTALAMLAGYLAAVQSWVPGQA